MESREQEVLDEIAASVVNDYYTAAVKWEVVLDALLTPVIADLLSAMTGEGFAYITKEFPIQNQKAGLQSAKADYLLTGKNADGERKVYLTELKTTKQSVKNPGQMSTYQNHLGEVFADRLGVDFLRLLFDVFEGTMKKGPKQDGLPALKECILKGSDFSGCLKELLGAISQDLVSEITEKALWEKMKMDGLTGSKKFLVQAIQILKACESTEYSHWYQDKVGLIYIVPEYTEVDGADYLISIDQMVNMWRKENLKQKIRQYLERAGNKVEVVTYKMEYFSWLFEKIFKPVFG